MTTLARSSLDELEQTQLAAQDAGQAIVRTVRVRLGAPQAAVAARAISDVDGRFQGAVDALAARRIDYDTIRTSFLGTEERARRHLRQLALESGDAELPELIDQWEQADLGRHRFLPEAASLWGFTESVEAAEAVAS